MAYAPAVQACRDAGGKMAYTPEQSFPGGAGHCVPAVLDTTGMTDAQLADAARSLRVMPGITPIPPGSIVPKRGSFWEELWRCRATFGCGSKYSFYSYGGFGIVAIGIGAYWWSRRG
jgi:hypothetical protein